jgi:hypothetical protein
MTCERDGCRIGARATYTKVKSSRMVDAVSHITTSLARLDMKVGPYIQVIYFNGMIG